MERNYDIVKNLFLDSFSNGSGSDPDLGKPVVKKKLIKGRF
jgi:hypothetical protein